MDKPNSSIQKLDGKMIISLNTFIHQKIIWNECLKRKLKNEFVTLRDESEICTKDLRKSKDIFLDTDDESRDSFDMNQVTSFNLERRYAATMKQCSDLAKLQNKMVDLQLKLSQRTNELLSSNSFQALIKTYKVQQMGLKSEYDVKKEVLQADTGVKDVMLGKIINKNKVLILEKNRHLDLLKKKSKKVKNEDYKSIIDIMR